MNFTTDELRMITAGLSILERRFVPPAGCRTLLERVQRELELGERLDVVRARDGEPRSMWSWSDANSPSLVSVIDRYLDAVAGGQSITEQIDAWAAVMRFAHEAVRARQLERADACGPRPDGGWHCRPWECSRESECLLTAAIDPVPSIDEQIRVAQDEVLQLSKHHPEPCRGCAREDAQERLWALLELKRKADGS